jgi:hypothetical protein
MKESKRGDLSVAKFTSSFEGDYLNGASKRGDSPSSEKIFPLPL